MRSNPCRYCYLSVEIKGKHRSSWVHECGKCENLEKHEKYLQSKRKFEAGETIKSIDELLEQEWVICNGQTKHIKVIYNFQFISVLERLKAGVFKKAIRKELGGKETK